MQFYANIRMIKFQIPNAGDYNVDLLIKKSASCAWATNKLGS